MFGKILLNIFVFIVSYFIIHLVLKCCINIFDMNLKEMTDAYTIFAAFIITKDIFRN